MTPQLGSTSSRAVFFLFFLLAAFAPPARSAPPACAPSNFTNPDPAAFIATSPNLVTLFDLSTNSSVCSVTVGNNPSHLAVTPDSSLLLVENDTDATISVISLTDGSTKATIDLTLSGVTKGANGITGNVAVSPDGSLAYVVAFPAPLPSPPPAPILVSIAIPGFTASIPGLVTANGTQAVGNMGISFLPDASKAYVTFDGNNTYEITVSPFAVSPAIAVTGGSITVDPNGTFAYAVDAAGLNDLSKIKTDNTFLTQNPMPVCSLASTTAISPDSATAYYTCPGSNFVQFIDTVTNAVTKTPGLAASGSTGPIGIAPATDGSSLLITNSDGSVSLITSLTAATPTVTQFAGPGGALADAVQRPVKLTLSPTTATVPIGGSQQFSSSVLYAFSTGKTLIWAVNGTQGGNSTVGTIDSTGLYTAPSSVPSPAQVTVSVTSSEVPAISKLYPLTATVVFPVSVTPKPSTLDLSKATTLQFAANQSVTWAVDGVTGGTTTNGTIDSTGLYTAPGKINPPSSVQVTATSVSDTTVSDASTLSLSSDIALSTIAFNPAAPLLIENPDTLSTTLTLDPYTQGVIWSIDGCSAATPATAACGSINASSGIFTPPSVVPYASQSNPQAPATVTFRATSVTDATKFSVTNPPVTITSNVALNGFQVNGTAPPSQLLIETASYTLTPVITGDTGQGVIWSILSCSVANPATSSCGKFTDVKAGTYVPPPIVPYATPVTPSSTASVTFQATSVADPLVSKTFTINIGSTVAITGYQVNGATPPSQLLIETPTYTLAPVISGDTGQGVTWTILSCSVANPASSKCGQFTNAGTGIYAPPLIVPYATPITPSSTASVTFQAASLADPKVIFQPTAIAIASTIQLSMSASISNVLIGGSLDFTPKTTGGNVTLVNDTNQGVTLAITGTCFAPPNFGSSATIPCGSFNGNSYSAPPVVPLSSAPPASLSQATRAQITVTATSVADPVRVASTMFVISSNISFTVLLGVDTTTLQNTGPTAASPTLAVGGPTSGYNTAAYLESNAAGFGSVTGLNWQATAGNIQAASGNQSAMYTSPAAVPNPATVTITGFAIADFTKTATASIPIVASKFVYANASSIGSTVQITIPSNASSGSLDLDFLGPTSGQITLACSNFVQLPNSSCSFSPNTTTSSSATGETLVTLTLSVTRSGGSYLRPPLAPGTPLPGLPGSDSVITLLTLLILVFAAKNRIRFLWAPASRWNRAFAVLLLCAVALTWAAACGQFSQPNTPAPPIPPTQTATGSVTVTGTPTTNSSASTDSLVVMVHVN